MDIIIRKTKNDGVHHASNATQKKIEDAIRRNQAHWELKNIIQKDEHVVLQFITCKHEKVQNNH